MIRRALVVVLSLTPVGVWAGEPYAYSPVGKRDPFRAPATPARPPAPCAKGNCRFSIDDFAVQAVVSESGTRLAMLAAPGGAGYIVRVGDVVGSERARVTRITSSGVELNTADPGAPARFFLLPLGHDASEQPEDLSR